MTFLLTISCVTLFVHLRPGVAVLDAAIGACFFLANKDSIVAGKNYVQPLPLSSLVTTVSFLTSGDRMRYDALVTMNEVTLVTHQHHTEKECCSTESFTLNDFLSELGLDISDVPSESENNWPAFVNSSIARPKTLIPISSIKRLHAATPPQNPDKFRDMCDSIESTGVYLYAIMTPAEIETKNTSKKVNIEFECRQFPRWSGYSEDPATGIAAGALAASLYKRKLMHTNNVSYICRQGTAMGRPSEVRVKIVDQGSSDEGCPATLKVCYAGSVVFDSASY